MNNHGVEGVSQIGDEHTVPWYPRRFLSGGAGVRSTAYRPTVSDYQNAVDTLNVGERNQFQPCTSPDGPLRRYLESLTRNPQLGVRTGPAQSAGHLGRQSR